jgi:hypothetical protein
MISKIRLAAMLAAMTVAMTTAAHSQYHADDGYQGDAAQARQYGYQSVIVTATTRAGMKDVRTIRMIIKPLTGGKQAAGIRTGWGQLGLPDIAMVSVPDISA